jgi:hypothetical protein
MISKPELGGIKMAHERKKNECEVRRSDTKKKGGVRADKQVKTEETVASC